MNNLSEIKEALNLSLAATEESERNIASLQIKTAINKLIDFEKDFNPYTDRGVFGPDIGTFLREYFEADEEENSFETITPLSPLDVIREELELLGSMISAERATCTPENRECTDGQMERIHSLLDKAFFKRS
jgi:hypothetical protein